MDTPYRQMLQSQMSVVIFFFLQAVRRVVCSCKFSASEFNVQVEDIWKLCNICLLEKALSCCSEE